MALAEAGLRGHGVELQPLEESHLHSLVDAASDGNLWELFFTSVPTPDTMGETVKRFIVERSAGTMQPFAVCLSDTGQAVGVTSLCHIDAANRRAEIGYTWYAASRQGTGINAACKLLLLTRAFDDMGCIAVEFRTHWLNHRSRKAIERLGAKQDGILRSHTIMPDGTVRDTVVYSIIASEWPAVRAELNRRLTTPR
ncbi:GNAT family N-acetyltransferase [Micromonospora arida]|uniref:GNAT family N-acetyltransferase n=1 Tax=Micromonospora arida TaxID=2203715 RepID=UPI00339ECCCC